MTTATRLGELTLEEAAEKAAGNWADFDCFVWWRKSELQAPEDWAIIYTHHRDSGLLDLSNADVIAKAMEKYTEGEDPDVVMESHHHWAVGHIDGFSVRVYCNGRITKAFRTYHELESRMADYPILDEADYSAREYDATVENIGDAAWRLKDQYKLPSDWQDWVYDWLQHNRDYALENVDDQGGYPEDGDLQAAFDALGYERIGKDE